MMRRRAPAENVVGKNYRLQDIQLSKNSKAFQLRFYRAAAPFGCGGQPSLAA
jgi:hypothetical protein